MDIGILKSINSRNQRMINMVKVIQTNKSASTILKNVRKAQETYRDVKSSQLNYSHTKMTPSKNCDKQYHSYISR